MVEEKKRCLAVGMNAHVTKPFTVEELLEALAPYCGGPAAAAGLMPAVVASGGAGHVGSEDEFMFLLPGVDFNQGLAHCDGNRELYARVLAEYRQEFIGLADALEACLAQGQWQELAALTHSFKGLSGTIGARDLQALAEDIERAGANHSPQLPHLIVRLRQLLDSTLATLCQIRPAPAEGIEPAALQDIAPSSQELLDELRRLLAEFDSAAQDFWKDHEEPLRGMLPPLIGKQMALAITHFQFEEALSLLTAQ
jgi:HPt (histidine-containing phosphotransfer) domain-containing protein